MAVGFKVISQTIYHLQGIFIDDKDLFKDSKSFILANRPEHEIKTPIHSPRAPFLVIFL
jgi:hypothetical protein